MRPWRGKESADILYVDNHHSLTKHLVEAGYLSKFWMAATMPIFYYLEVKTTTKGCGEPFFMSQTQRELVSGRPNGPYFRSG